MTEHRTGIFIRSLDERTFLADASCWWCEELCFTHLAEPLELELKPGELVHMTIQAVRDFHRETSDCDAIFYCWDAVVDRVELTTVLEDIRQMRARGATCCGFWQDLNDGSLQARMDFIADHPDEDYHHRPFAVRHWNDPGGSAFMKVIEEHTTHYKIPQKGATK